MFSARQGFPLPLFSAYPQAISRFLAARMLAMTVRSSLAVIVPLLLAPTVHGGNDFRIETDVFVENQKQPVAQTLTLFADDVVYDFMLLAPNEITMFDRQRGELFMLDPSRKLKARWTTAELIQFTASIRMTAKNAKDNLFGMEFAGHFDEETAVVMLEGKNLVYRAVGHKPKLDGASGRYSEFADWYAQLNAARPGNPPPFGRIELNRRLKELHMVPTEIDRTLTLPGRLGNVKKKVTSRQTFTWLLSTTDRKRIQDVSEHMATFKVVTLKEYWGLDELAANRN